MNISQYFIYLPYRTAWTVSRLFRKKKSIHFYCAGHVDYVIIKSVIQHFPQAEIVAKNSKVKEELKQYGVNAKVYPTFPDILVMPRHTARKFPEKKMIKIGLRHGAYHFKDFVKAARYHAFDVYFVTSQKEVELARLKGITNTVGVGFPKLDAAFDGSCSDAFLDNLRKAIKLDKNKPVVIFTATWNSSGMSAIDKWVDRLDEISKDYNVLVTVHHWTEPEYQDKIVNTPGVVFLKDKDILPYLMVADVMIADMSSIIAEFCALDKPIITFRVPDQKRTSEEIKNMLDEISIRIDSFEELKKALQEAIQFPEQLSAKRQHYNTVMFDHLDGNAGLRAANYIKEHFLN
jgi:CDP-glycerol glycerophosphotransferase (TagB/SpsB family)